MVYVPNDLERLRVLLVKLKNKEAKLEADLAIKENPEFEGAIISMMLKIADIKNYDKVIRMSVPTPGKLEGEIERIEKAIVYFTNKVVISRGNMSSGGARLRIFYEAKVQGLEFNLKSLQAGGSLENLGTSQKRQTLQHELQEEVIYWRGRFDECGVAIFDLIPSLEVFVS